MIWVVRWYQLCYQMGVLISRSSLHFVKIRKDTTRFCLCQQLSNRRTDLKLNKKNISVPSLVRDKILLTKFFALIDCVISSKRSINWLALLQAVNFVLLGW